MSLGTRGSSSSIDRGLECLDTTRIMTIGKDEMMRVGRAVDNPCIPLRTSTEVLLDVHIRVRAQLRACVSDTKALLRDT